MWKVGVSQPNPSGLCFCGCGHQTAVARQTIRATGIVSGESVRYLPGHNTRGKRGPDNNRWRGGAKKSGGYVTLRAPGHGHIYEHILVAARALGRPIPKGAEVHHVNGDVVDNRPENLVICQDASYHKLLHRRQRALRATGNPNAVKCWVCKQWGMAERDDMWMCSNGNKAHHRACRRKGAEGHGEPLVTSWN